MTYTLKIKNNYVISGLSKSYHIDCKQVIFNYHKALNMIIDKHIKKPLIMYL